MLDKLIQTGETLESEASEGMGGKFFDSINFEQWASKSVLYLENYHSKSIVTEKAKEGFKKLNSNINYDYYQFLLGALKATKEFEDEKLDEMLS
ncbi:hypothetical protein [Neobacillus sp. PS3-40]|uniref:hypothetical protein n=1 Tax=Neobacillus sp. PS3-40 TaxID=3070679 RepID=UPI0027E15434|nr:hypothetical protein [Neobacillus sp. PS3-40]WML44072.1 hypothetical protein RCG20_20200 [Neobacillus sp. PS3-40]